MITNTTAKSTYVVASGVTEYAIGFVYKTNPDGSPQIKVYVNDAVNTPLVYGTDYTMSLDGANVVIVSGAEAGDTLTIIRNIPIVQLSDYNIGRIDPEQIENDFDLCVERDQQQSARVTVTEEQLAAHDGRITAVEDVIPESATTENLLATVADIPTDLGQLTNTPGYITGITSSDVTTALGYTPYSASNPNGYTSNEGTVTSVNNVLPVNGNVTLEMPVVGNGTITITQGGVSKGTFTTNQSGNTTIALDAGGGGGGGAVDSVNGQTGTVVLTASDVGALPDSTTIPDAQIQSDWNQSDNTKVDYIKNKPTIPSAQVNSDWNAASGVAEILNKPTIPIVNDSTITITQGGIQKGSFTLNQSSGGTIDLDAGGGLSVPQSIDAEIVGTLAVTNNGDVSGFGYNNYLVIPSDFDISNTTSFEMVFAFKLSNEARDKAEFLGIYKNPKSSAYFALNCWRNSKHLTFRAFKGVGQEDTIVGTTELSSDTKYYTKVQYDGTDYKLFLSTDGVNWASEGSATATYIPSGAIYEMGRGNVSTPGTYYIYMSECYVKKDNILIWQGTDAPGLHQRVTKGHEVIEFQAPTAANDYTWYRKYADGWVEQGGISNTNSGTSGTITLPVTMQDNNYTAIAGNGNNAADNYFTISRPEATTTTIKWYKSSSSMNGYWEVKGMYAQS